MKENYKPVSVLPIVSKIYEWFLFKEISNFIEAFFLKQQCSFRKGYNMQYCLLSVGEIWKSAVDKGKYLGALLTVLSQAFDCISHKLVLAKVHAYWFNLRAVKLIHSYLTNRKQRVKVIGDYSCWKDVLFGVPQRSVQLYSSMGVLFQKKGKVVLKRKIYENLGKHLQNLNIFWKNARDCVRQSNVRNC